MDRKTQNIATEIAEEIREMQSFKSNQTVGADSYNIAKSSSVLYSYVVPNFTTNYRIRVRFRAVKQANAFAELSYRVYLNAPPPNPENKQIMFDIEKRNSVSGSLDTLWDIYINNYSGATVTYYVQFFVQSFDTGVVESV